MNRPHFRTPYSEGFFRRNMQKPVELEALPMLPGAWKTGGGGAG